MNKRTEDDFIEWLGGASFYVNYARYGQFGGHGFIVISNYDYDERLESLVKDLDGDDVSALYAEEEIKKINCWLGRDVNPSEAMRILVQKMRKFYFDELNGKP